MIKPEQVPEAVVEALIATLYGKPGLPHREALAAALSAWPGMQRRFHIEQALVLPLTQQASDDHL